jgi:anti-sigma factor RsiW
MRCADVERFVDSFIDCELAEPEQLEFEGHLAGCAACRRFVHEQASFKATLRAVAPRPAAPEGLRLRLAAALDAEDRATAVAPVGPPLPALPARARLWRVAVPAAALGLALLFGGPRIGGPGESPVVMDSIVKHQRDLPLEVTGAPEIVRSWFDGKVPFAVRAPQLEPMASLVGGRLISLGNREAAYLIYQVNGELGERKVSVFVFDAHDLQMMPPQRRVVGQREVYVEGARGYHVAVFRDNDVGYAITGSVDEPVLLRLVSTFGR